MNSINLMPKIPFAARYFVLLAVLIVLLIGGAGAGLYWYSGQLQVNAEKQKAEGSQSQKQLQTLVSETQIDPIVREISGMMTEYTFLKETRPDWVPVFKAIAAAMPQTARMTQATQQADRLTMTVQFVSLDEAAQYVLRLGRNALFTGATLMKADFQPAAKTGASLYEAQIEIKLKPVQK